MQFQLDLGQRPENIRQHIRVTAKQHKVKTWEFVGGFETGGPNYIVTSIDVTEDGKRIWVPAECFNDLGNLDGLSVYRESKFLILLISGGDASSGYDAKLVFKDGRPWRRVITYGEDDPSKDVIEYRRGKRQ